MGLFLCAGPLLLAGVFLLVLSRRKPDPSGGTDARAVQARVWLGGLLLIAGIATAFWLEPWFMPERRLKQIEESARPLIAAIDAFDARKGCPPTVLTELVPEWIAQIPTTGCRAFESFSYQYVSSVTEPRWKLSVSTGGMNVEDDSCFYFDSWTRRWGYSAH